jgi:hypothetical protein
MLKISQLADFDPVMEYDVNLESLGDDFVFKCIKLNTRFVLETLSHAKESGKKRNS